LLFVHRRPRAPLDRFVEFVWMCRQPAAPHALERVLPTGVSQFIINLKEDETRLYDPDQGFRCSATSGSLLSGGHSRVQIIDTSEQEHVAGVAFKPGGTVAFLRVPAHETADRDVPLEALIGVSRTAALRERLLESDGEIAKLEVIESALLEMWTAKAVHPAVAFALEAIDRAPDTTTIAAVTDAIGLSPKRFIDDSRTRWA
jgi:hypothetical protein